MNFLTSKGATKGAVYVERNQTINRFKNGLNINRGGVIRVVNKFKVKGYYQFHLRFRFVPNSIVVLHTRDYISFFPIGCLGMEEFGVSIPHF